MDKGKVASMLEKLKLMLLKLSFLPTKTEEANQKELLLSRDTLEIGAQHAVMQEDIPGFERYMAQLQRLPAKEVQNNVYIKHPVSLEQYIMEGSYNKVLLAKGNVPAESYKYFIDILMITVRNEIASCLEKAYADISCSDAARMLSIGAGDVNAYASERGWQIVGGRLQFRGADAENEEQGVPSVQLANMAMTYAREMEQIV